MERRFAQIISHFFHPIGMPTLAIILLLNVDTYLSYTITLPGKLAIYSITFINTGLLPALLAWIQYRQGFIKNLNLASQQERIFPILITSIFYFFCFYVLQKNNIPNPVVFSILGAAMAVALAFLINFFLKISIHSISAGGILGMLLGISEGLTVELTGVLFVCILIAGLVGFARLKLNRHRPVEVYAGFFLGFLCVYGSLLFGLGA